MYWFFAVMFRRRFVLYVHNLHIEQSLAARGRVPHVGLSRFFERLFFKFASALLVFNLLNVVYLSKIYGLNRSKFSLLRSWITVLIVRVTSRCVAGLAVVFM
jgi:hypothetical protein